MSDVYTFLSPRLIVNYIIYYFLKVCIRMYFAEHNTILRKTMSYLCYMYKFITYKLIQYNYTIDS